MKTSKEMYDALMDTAAELNQRGHEIKRRGDEEKAEEIAELRDSITEDAMRLKKIFNLD